MNIRRFSLLSALAYLLRCNGQIHCVGLLLNHLRDLSPLGTLVEIEKEAFDCQQELSHSPHIPPNFPRCVPECNANRNPNVVLCLQGCWEQNGKPPPACLSLLFDISTLPIPETKTSKAILDAIDFFGCVNDLSKHVHLHPGGGGTTSSASTTTTTTTSTTATSCSTTLPATITCSPGDVQPTVVPCSCCFQNLCSGHPIQCGCLCSCTT